MDIYVTLIRLLVIVSDMKESNFLTPKFMMYFDPNDSEICC